MGRVKHRSFSLKVRPDTFPCIGEAQKIIAGEAGVVVFVIDRGRASPCKAGGLTSSPFIRFEFLRSAGLATTIPFAAGSTLEGMGPFSDDGVSQPVRGPVTHPPGFPLLRPGELDKASGDDGAGRHEARRRITPERHEQLAGERNDHDPPKPAVGAARPFDEPLAQSTLRLMMKPAPRDLQHVRSEDGGAGFAMPWSRMTAPLAHGIGARPLHAASSRRLLNLRQKASRTSTEESLGPTPLIRASAAIIAASASAASRSAGAASTFLTARWRPFRADGLELVDDDPQAGDLAADLIA